MMKTVLLIEDDPFLSDIYNTKLEEVGYDVDIAIDAKEGLKKIKENIPDLVLLDIVLPGIDGWEFLSLLRKDIRFKDLKIIILSNLSQEEEVRKGLDLGVVKYLIKAHNTPSQVVEEIKEVLNN